MIWCLSLNCLSAKEKGDIFTKVYAVPPTFLSMGGSRDASSTDHPATPAKTAKQILEQVGITFNEGCSAIYNAATSQLIVRNTESQMELVEAYIDSVINHNVEKQIYLSFRVAEFDDEELKSAKAAGFDWLIAPPQEPAQSLVKARALDSEASFLEELSRPPKLPSAIPPVSRGIAAVFTDPQFQLAMRALTKLPELDFLSCPSLMVRSGQPALVQVNLFRVGAIAVLGADEFTIDLSVFLAETGEALFEPGDELTTPFKVTIWDGQTVVLSMSREEEPLRVVFATARILDPAGRPINPGGGQQAANLPSKAKEEVVDLESGVLGPFANLPGNAEAEAVSSISDSPESRTVEVDKVLADGDDKWSASLPIGRTHLVQKGETLVSIAEGAATSIAGLKELNGINGDLIQVGQVLLLPPLDVPEANSIDLAETLQTIIIPSVEFRDQSLTDCLGFFHRVLLSKRDSGLFPSSVPAIVLEDAAKYDKVSITLKLAHVPLSEALRYVSSLAQCKFRAEGNRIIVSGL